MSAAVPRSRRTVENVRVTIILVLLTVSAREQWAADHIGKEVMRCVGELEP